MSDSQIIHIENIVRNEMELKDEINKFISENKEEVN